MKHKLIALLLASLLLLSGCGSHSSSHNDDVYTIAATTYPVYLFTTALTQGAENVEVKLLINEQTSCLHDYTLTVRDMRIIEGADAIVMNGTGLEAFLSKALSTSSAVTVDCSAGISLLESDSHHHEHEHDHDTDCEYDPHIWLSPFNAASMLETIAQWLLSLEDGNQSLYAENLTSALAALAPLNERCSEFSSLTDGLITFHDGFQYFAHSCNLTILHSIEEEEGSEASASEMAEIIALIRKHQVSAIFTEVNGPQSTAKAIARETGVEIYHLSTIMSGSGEGIQPYIDAMNANYDAVLQALGGQ